VAEHAVRRYAGWLAGRALTAAAYGDWQEGHALTARVIPHGGIAVEQLVTVWCEAILAEPPLHMQDEPAMEFAGLDRTPALRWSAQVLAAANQDRTLLPLLVNAVPAGELAQHLAGLLDLAVAAVMARDDGFWP
jgi:hypothetical protein